MCPDQTANVLNMALVFRKPVSSHTLMPFLLNYERRGTWEGTLLISVSAKRVFARWQFGSLNWSQGWEDSRRCFAALQPLRCPSPQEMKTNSERDLQLYPCVNITGSWDVLYVTKLGSPGLLSWILSTPHEEMMGLWDLSCHQMKNMVVFISQKIGGSRRWQMGQVNLPLRCSSLIYGLCDLGQAI